MYQYLLENQSQFICTAGIDSTTGALGEVLNDNGLYSGHEYSLIGCYEVFYNDGAIQQLVKIRNPWGEGEYNGDWSDKSEKWNLISGKHPIK